MNNSTVIEQAMKILKAANEWQKNISLYNFFIRMRYPLFGGILASVGYAYVKRDAWMPNSDKIRKQLHYENAATRELFDRIREKYYNKLAEELMPSTPVDAAQ